MGTQKEMKPCPHCGSKCSIRLTYELFSFGSYEIACENCCIEYHATEEAALAAWNTRAGEDTIQAEIVRLRAENERLLRMLEKDAKM